MTVKTKSQERQKRKTAQDETFCALEGDKGRNTTSGSGALNKGLEVMKYGLVKSGRRKDRARSYEKKDRTKSDYGSYHIRSAGLSRPSLIVPRIPPTTTPIRNLAPIATSHQIHPQQMGERQTTDQPTTTTVHAVTPRTKDPS